MIALSLSLTACFGWGVADFLGGWHSRRLPTLLVLLLSNLFGLIVLGLIVAWRGTAFPMQPALLWAVAAALAAVVGMTLLYKGLATGTMAIVSPISATGVILPILFGLAYGERLTGLQWAGILAAVTGTVLAAREDRALTRDTRLAAGTGLALGSAVAVGVFFILMARASEVDPYWATLVMRLCFGALIVPLLAIARPSFAVDRRRMAGLFTMGTLDALASVAFAVATTVGLLSLVSVVGSLYPVVTVLLSVLVLRERPGRWQAVGVVLALTGVGMISA